MKKKSIRNTSASKKNPTKESTSNKIDDSEGKIQSDQGKTFYWQSNIRGSILSYYETLTNHNEKKANWLLSLGGVLLVIIFGQSQILMSDFSTRLGAVFIVLGCLGAMFSTILVLIPRTEYLMNNSKNQEDHRIVQKFDVYFYKDIQEHFTADSLSMYLKELRGSSEELDKAYAYGIYWFANYRLPFVIRQLSIGGWSLFWGVTIGSILVLYGLAFL